MCGKVNWRAWAIVLIAVTLSPALHAAQAARKPGASEIRSARKESQAAVWQLDAANGLLQRGLFDLAQTEYRGVLSADPDAGTRRSAQYGLAVCLFRLERHADAADALKSLAAVDDFEYGAEVGVMLGRSLLALDRQVEALAAFDAVVRRFPKHALSATASVGAIEALYRSGGHDAILKRAPRTLRRLEKGPMRLTCLSSCTRIIAMACWRRGRAKLPAGLNRRCVCNRFGIF